MQLNNQKDTKEEYINLNNYKTVLVKVLIVKFIESRTKDQAKFMQQKSQLKKLIIHQMINLSIFHVKLQLFPNLIIH